MVCVCVYMFVHVCARVCVFMCVRACVVVVGVVAKHTISGHLFLHHHSNIPFTSYFILPLRLLCP